MVFSWLIQYIKAYVVLDAVSCEQRSEGFITRCDMMIHTYVPGLTLPGTL